MSAGREGEGERKRKRERERKEGRKGERGRERQGQYDITYMEYKNTNEYIYKNGNRLTDTENKLVTNWKGTN